MYGVTECRSSGQRNFTNLVTFNAVSGHGKSTLAVVAAAAGFSLLHLGHGDVRVGLVRLEKGVMTIRTGEHAEMLAVTERQRPEIRNDYGYRINRVAAGAVLQLRCFRVFLVVACAARFSLLHLCHRNGRVVLAIYMENGIVARGTIVVQAFEVVFVAEGDVSGIPGFNKERLLEISRNKTWKSDNNCQQ